MQIKLINVSEIILTNIAKKSLIKTDVLGEKTFLNISTLGKSNIYSPIKTLEISHENLLNRFCEIIPKVFLRLKHKQSYKRFPNIQRTV